MSRWARYILIALFTLFLAAKGIVPAWTTMNSDFANYYVSASLVAEHGKLDSLYDDAWFQDQIHKHGISTTGKFAPFPPATAWIMLPLTPFPPLAAQRIWTLCNLACLGISIFLFVRITFWRVDSTALLFLAAGFMLANNFAFGQLYLVMLTGLLASYYLMSKAKPGIAGGILAIFTVIKYFPIAILGAYFLLKKYRIILFSGGAILLAVGLQFLFFGSDVMKEFAGDVLLPHLDGDLRRQGQFTYLYQSWDSFFRFLFEADSQYNPRPAIPWSNGRLVVKTGLYSFLFLSAAWVLWKHRETPGEQRTPVYLAVITVLALLVLPASATYHFILLIFPLSLLIRSQLVHGPWLILLLGLYTIIGFIPYHSFFILAEKSGVFFAYPRLWLITLFYFTVLIAVYPRAGNKKIIN